MAKSYSFTSSYWEANPTNRCINAICGVDELRKVLNLHFLHGPKLLRGQNPRESVLLNNVPRLSQEEIQIALKLEHELDHLQRHLSTAFGFLYHSIESKAVRLFFEYIENFDKEDIHFPFYPTRYPYIQDILKSESKDAIKSNQKQFYCSKVLSNMIVCDNASPKHPSSEFRFSAIQFFLNDLYGGKGKIEKSEIENKFLQIPNNEQLGNIIATDERYFPVISVQENQQTRLIKLGASALLESLAMSRERTWRHYIKGRQKDHDIYFGASNYEAAQQCWIKIIPNPLFTEDIVSKSWQKVGFKTFKGFPTEFYIAVDLALWIPITPEVFSNGINEELKWVDIQPGWRFLRILLWLRRNNIKFTGVGPMTEDWSDSLVNLQKTICNDFGWINPVELSKSWKSYFDASRLQQTYKNWMIEDDWGRAIASLELLDTRLKMGARSIIQYPLIAKRKNHYFQAISAEEDMFCNPYIINDYEEKGYKIPVVFGLLKGIEILGELGSEMANIQISQSYGEKILHAVKNYSKRNFGNSFSFG